MKTRLLREQISGNVRLLRRERRWTQTELAKKLGLSQNRLSEIEHGQGYFSAEQFLLILKTFNVPVDYFTSGKTSSSAYLRNALVHLGAKHLQEQESLPSDKVKQVNDLIREVLVSAQSPRDITAIAQVAVTQIQAINLHRLRAQLAEAGYDLRLGWVLEHTLEAIKLELREKLPKAYEVQYRKAEMVLNLFVRQWIQALAKTKPQHSDILDADIVSEKSAAEVRAASSSISKRWHIITRIQQRDFVGALRAARG